MAGETPEKAIDAANDRGTSDPTERKMEEQPEKEQKASSTQEKLRQAMSTRQLQSKYEEIFGVPTKVHNKDWILNKIRERVELELPTEQPTVSPSEKAQKRAQATTGFGSGAAIGKAKEGGGTKRAGLLRRFPWARYDAAETMVKTGAAQRWRFPVTNIVQST